MTPTEAALRYLKRGWHSIPIQRLCPACRHTHPQQACSSTEHNNPCSCCHSYQREEGIPTKGPSLKGWQERRLEEAACLTAFHPSDNIGLLLGEPSQWLIDVDLDAPESVALAPHFLPPTDMVSGRTGKLYSHYWYYAPNSHTSKVQYAVDHRKATVLEIRSTGGQTVVPPSLHPDGGEYIWHKEGNPAAVDAGVLEKACLTLALASILAAHWPGQGARHDAALPIAGLLAHAGWAEHAAARVLYLAAQATGDSESGDREYAVQTTYRRFHAGQPTQGGRKLRDFFSSTVASKIAELAYAVSGKSPTTLIPSSSSPAPQRWKPVVRTFSQIQKKPIPWLWYPYIPLGRITMMEGDPGNGKSYLSLALATCVSLGGWGFEVEGGSSVVDPADVLCIACEDEPESVSKDRLDRLQANQGRVHILEGKTAEHEQTLTRISLDDLPVISEAIGDYHAKLVFVDPIQAYVGEQADTNKAEYVRFLMEELKLLAQTHQCAIVLIRHLSKGQKDRAAYRGFGSIQFYAAARSVLLVSEQEELRESAPGGHKRLFAMVHAKTNMGIAGPTVQFEIGPEGFFWRGSIDLTAEDLFTPVADRKQKQQAMQDARGFLVTSMTGGKAWTLEDIVKRGRKCQLREADLTAAMTALRMTRVEQDGEVVFMLPPKFNN